MKKILAALLCCALLLCCCSAFAADYIIATDTAFRPFEFQDETGAYVGIDVDLLAAVAENQGFTYELQPLGWDASIAACQAGQADGMIAGASITEERKANGWIGGFEDQNGRTVAVKNGTMSDAYATSLAETYGFTVQRMESSPDIYQAVITGTCAACFDDTPIMADYIKSNGVPLQLVDGTANEGADYGFAVFSADKQELIDKFNAGLANIKANGKYDEILAKYLGE